MLRDRKCAAEGRRRAEGMILQRLQLVFGKRRSRPILAWWSGRIIVERRRSSLVCTCSMLAGGRAGMLDVRVVSTRLARCRQNPLWLFSRKEAVSSGGTDLHASTGAMVTQWISRIRLVGVRLRRGLAGGRRGEMKGGQRCRACCTFSCS